MYRSVSRVNPSQRAGSARAISTTNAPTLCVVDTRPSEAQAWESWAADQGLQVRYFASSGEALRFGRLHDVRQWVVNASLPGISGIELCQMLRQERRATAVYVLTDCYSAAEERAARIAGATMYLCRPPDRTWLLPIVAPRPLQAN